MSHQAPTFVSPKTKRSRRKIALPTTVIEALHQHRARQLAERLALGSEWEDLDLVFCNSEGHPLDPTHLLRRQFYPLLKRAGLPTIHFHDLRHTAATLFLLRGVNPKVVSELLGHSSVAITLDVYSHVLPDMQDQATAVMDAMISAQ
jgi:integrase